MCWQKWENLNCASHGEYIYVCVLFLHSQVVRWDGISDFKKKTQEFFFFFLSIVYETHSNLCLSTNVIVTLAKVRTTLFAAEEKYL